MLDNRTCPPEAPSLSAVQPRGRAPRIGAGVVCLLAVVGGVLVAQPATAAEKKMQFWNTTSVELDEVFLAPAGTTKWGPNQCLNDDDKTVEADERLALKDVKPGKYDVKIRDVHGRTCYAKNIEVKSGGKYAFSIDDKELTDCTN